MMIERGEKMKTFSVEGWFDCGKPETLLSTNKYLLTQQAAPAHAKNVVVTLPAFISPTAKVSNAIIGPNATIADGATISNAIIRNSIISENAIVENALIEDSIIGSHSIVRGNYKRINIGDSSELEFN